MVATKSAVQVTDLAADQDYVERRSPFIVAAIELGGVRTVLAVPMLKENELIGAFMCDLRGSRATASACSKCVSAFGLFGCCDIRAISPAIR